MRKIAVILFNLGGPDAPQAVRPFLFNLFHDPAIIRLPQPLRYLVAQLISRRRAPIARLIYNQIGGSSPILANTKAQAELLQEKLNSSSGDVFKTFVAMRYWNPMANQTALEVKTFAPDEIVLLPLYPQFSTTTTGSSVDEWHKAADRADLSVRTKVVCCYPQEVGFINALAELTYLAYEKARNFGVPRVLFSAHGLPEKIIQRGDPYQMQCGLTVEALRAEMGIYELDSVLCFQSRVGPMKWIEPSTDSEIRRAGTDKVPLVIVPIAFVSDHSETLVEIDIEYRHLAEKAGVPFFINASPVGVMPAFISGLADLTHSCLRYQKDCVSASGERLCPPEYTGCACRTGT